MLENYKFITLLLFLNFFLVFFFNYYSSFFKITDRPDGTRKLHKKEVKVLGGSIILANLSLCILYFYYFEKNTLIQVFSSEKKLLVFFVSSILIYIIGLIDDKISLPALNKLFLVTLVIATSLLLNTNLILDIKLSFVDTINLNKFSFFFTLFSYIIFINAFNMLDGINLQVGFYSLFITLFLILNGLNLMLGLTILLALLSYLKLNYENKVFFGDNGTMLLAYMFSYFFIELYSNETIKFADEILLVLLLPGLEITRLILERTFSNANILKADRNHIHHLIYFIKNNYLSFYIIQALLILPYVFSSFLKNNLISILIFSIIYFVLILFFKKNK